jgi:hypothetical protein
MSTTKRANRQNKYSDTEKLKAAYALNLCTVSVSQIIDYHDAYILEQEYEAILNNLNLKEMPKDEALLRIITELLNTITFFRIQDIKKTQIEKRYQQRVKNAIWAAVPSLSVVVSGNPIAIALSLATQIGSGYMNYRREKANIATDQEDAEVELQITAIEQLNALRRELFTTAWRLADEYDFEDEWRLTEKQIKQYNEILMDSNEYRKYARLEAIQDKFAAYPPFWYYYGHTAHYIAVQAKERLAVNSQETEQEIEAYQRDSVVAKEYIALAEKHYENYYNLTNKNILREDQLTATCALEYADLLIAKGKQDDKPKVRELIGQAEKMAPTSFDILQLCAVSYLKCGATDEAARLLKVLVNESYNAASNARLLSRIYVSRYLKGNNTAQADYKLLEMQIEPLYLYPMPKGALNGYGGQTLSSAELNMEQEKPQLEHEADKNIENSLEEDFFSKQKDFLKKAYQLSIDAFAEQQHIAFNAVLPLPYKPNQNDIDYYYGNTSTAQARRMEMVESALTGRSRKDYICRLSECGFRAGYIRVLNETVEGIEKLSRFRNLDSHDLLVQLIEDKIRQAKWPLQESQEKMDGGVFNYRSYKNLVDQYSYQYFTQSFFSQLKDIVSNMIDAISNMEMLEFYSGELADFCETHKLPEPTEYAHTYKPQRQETIDHIRAAPFSVTLLGDEDSNEKIEKMCSIIRDYSAKLIRNPADLSGTRLHLRDSTEFQSYWDNDSLSMDNRTASGINTVRKKALAILDDVSKRDVDLIFCVDGIAIVQKNKIQNSIPYGEIKYSCQGNDGVLKQGKAEIYQNKNVDITIVYNIISKLNQYNLQTANTNEDTFYERLRRILSTECEQRIQTADTNEDTLYERLRRILSTECEQSLQTAKANPETERNLIVDTIITRTPESGQSSQTANESAGTRRKSGLGPLLTQLPQSEQSSHTANESAETKRKSGLGPLLTQLPQSEQSSHTANESAGTKRKSGLGPLFTQLQQDEKNS